MVELVIDGRAVSVPPGTSILDAAASAGIDIPALCYDKTLSTFGACRLCSVEIEGRANLVAACATPVADGLVVLHRIRDRRRRAAHRARPAALRPPPGLPDLREGRRLPAAGVLLPLRRRAHELRQGRDQAARARRRQPPDSARPEQVHPVRQVRARLPGGPGDERRRLRRPRLRVDRDLVVRPPARTATSAASAGSASICARPAPWSTSSSRAPAPGSARRCAPPARSAAWAATST